MSETPEAARPTTMGQPNFKCEKCGRGLGASRASVDAPWVPARCFYCESKLAAKAAAERRKLGHVVLGVDLDKVLAVYRKSPPFVGNLGHVKLEVGHRAEGGTCGRAWTRQRRMRVAVGPGATPARVLEVLVHEMCHLACPPREQHGERFRLTLRRAARELWGIEVPLVAGKNRGEEKNAAYAMDRLITAELEKKIAAGGVELFPTSKEEAAKRTRAEASKLLVEKRAAHAVRMWWRWERKAKAAQRAMKRWRAKVRYYERAAARRGGA